MYENILDQILPNKLHGPLHCKIGVACVYSGHVFSNVITWQYNPPISQFNSPCNEFASVRSIFVYTIYPVSRWQLHGHQFLPILRCRNKLSWRCTYHWFNQIIKYRYLSQPLVKPNHVKLQSKIKINASWFFTVTTSWHCCFIVNIYKELPCRFWCYLSAYLDFTSFNKLSTNGFYRWHIKRVCNYVNHHVYIV